VAGGRGSASGEPSQVASCPTSVGREVSTGTSRSKGHGVKGQSVEGIKDSASGGPSRDDFYHTSAGREVSMGHGVKRSPD
jgi:hypothetical protein